MYARRAALIYRPLAPSRRIERVTIVCTRPKCTFINRYRRWVSLVSWSTLFLLAKGASPTGQSCLHSWTRFQVLRVSRLPPFTKSYLYKHDFIVSRWDNSRIILTCPLLFIDLPSIQRITRLVKQSNDYSSTGKFDAVLENRPRVR